LTDNATAGTERTEREVDLEGLRHRLRGEGIYPGDLLSGAHGFLGQTPSRLVGIMFDDLAGETEPVNIPAAGPRYRPWTRRNALAVSEVFKLKEARDILRLTGRNAGTGTQPDNSE
jgi:4-alpha-glucanotransferase